MARKLNRAEPFATIHGGAEGACFMQDEAYFDALGNEVGDAKPAAKPAAKPVAEAAPVSDIDQQVAQMLEGDAGGVES